MAAVVCPVALIIRRATCSNEESLLTPGCNNLCVPCVLCVWQAQFGQSNRSKRRKCYKNIGAVAKCDVMRAVVHVSVHAHSLLHPVTCMR